MKDDIKKKEMYKKYAKNFIKLYMCLMLFYSIIYCK